MRWMFELPRVSFDRRWQLGPALFRPPGEAAEEVGKRQAQVFIHESWAFGHEISAQVASEWAESSTVEVTAEDQEEAQARLSEALAVLRFLMRSIPGVHVDHHRIGAVGEVETVIRRYLVLFDEERVAAGWTRIDSQAPFRFADEILVRWENDPQVRWLSEELGQVPAERSLSGSRAITSLQALDRAFLSLDPVIRVVLYAVAIETLLCDAPGEASNRPTPLRIAARVAFLVCENRCAVEKPACPYVLGFTGQRHLWATAEQWAAAGGEWRCSTFLDIARPDDMDAYFELPSLFGARNEAVHEGRTSLDESALRWMSVRAYKAVSGFLRWVVERPGATISDLDAELARGVEVLGRMRPGEA